MYLVSADRFKQPSISPISAAQPKVPPYEEEDEQEEETNQKKREHSYEKWVKYRKNAHEADMKYKTQIQAIAEFLKNVLPDTAFSSLLKSSPPSNPKTLRFSRTQSKEEAAGLPTPAIA